MSMKEDLNDTHSPRFTRTKDETVFHYQQDTSKWRKKAWTTEEDQYLIRLVGKYGAQKWTVIAQNMPGRIGKQCRQRWHNHLNPEINKEEWSLNEQWMLFLLHKNMGNQWAQFTRQLRGRTDNAIKNHWNSAMKKKSSQYMEKYKKGRAKFQGVKNTNKEFDKYLMDKLLASTNIPELEELQVTDKSKLKSESAIKSTATIIQKKQEPKSYQDLQKTIKKKTQPISTISSRQTAGKQKKTAQNFNYHYHTRLSQLSLFGGPSRQNIVSAFSLLEQQQPVILEPQPSIEDISLAQNCFQEGNQDRREGNQLNYGPEVTSQRRLLRPCSLQKLRLSVGSLPDCN